MNLRSGAPVLKGRRKNLSVYLSCKPIMIKIPNGDMKTCKEGLGLQQKKAQNARSKFADELRKLSSQIIKQQQKAKSQINNGIDESKQEEILRQSLTLDKDDCLQTLDKLREIGASLRTDLSPKIIELFQSQGFLSVQNSLQEPSLTFVEDVNEFDAQAPILWDMMHEIGQDKLDNTLEESNWERFWGFRVPITHWMVDKTVSKEIRLKQAFSAIHEELSFAIKEQQLLTQRFLDQKHRSLAEVFRCKVDEELRDKIQDEIKIQFWWDECQSNFWLKKYFSELEDEKGRRAAEQWIKTTLISIFEDCKKYYNLLHFACHCEANQETGFLSVLNMKVAGKVIPLDVAFMATKLLPNQDECETDWDIENSQGRLVFLNACDSGGHSDSEEYPSFPQKWIECQNASAVIVTLCKVPDYFAYAFAEKFYDNLFKGITEPNSVSYISEALLETRRYFMKEHHNPLGLAYVLYASDGARVTAH